VTEVLRAVENRWGSTSVLPVVGAWSAARLALADLALRVRRSSPHERRERRVSTHRLRGALAAALVTLGAGIGAVLPASAAAHGRPVTHHRTPRHLIPQHGRGDHDADNFGAPSDGDGNV
jgi:hypothetical protein